MAELIGYKIFIDPGHGGTDPGATSSGYEEADIVLAVGLKLKTRLEGWGATVQMSRTTDTYPTLQARSTASNNFGAHIFVSLHNNASNGQASGTETWVHDNSSQLTRNLATMVNNEVVKAYGSNNRGLKYCPSGRNGDNIYVIDPNNTNSWAILPELLFIDNATDRAKLINATYQQKAADAIATGILSFTKTLPLMS